MAGIHCNGNETTLFDCQYTTNVTSDPNCYPYSIAGVICSGNTTKVFIQVLEKPPVTKDSAEVFFNLEAFYVLLVFFIMTTQEGLANL